jgi:hypothetical protein
MATRIKTPLTMSTEELVSVLAGLSERLEKIADALEEERFGPPRADLRLVDGPEDDDA